MRELVHALILLGVLQGVVLVPVLASRRANRLANRILAALVAAVTLMMVFGEVGHVWGFSGHPHLLGLGASLPFALGPLLYLYVVALTRPAERFDPRWLAHGLPLLGHLVFMTLAFYMQDAETKLALARAADAGNAGPVAHVLSSILALQAFVYLGLSWRELERYRVKMQGFFGDLHRVELRWLRALVAANGAVWVVVLGGTIARMLGHGVPALGAIVPIGSTAVLFLIGYASVFQADVSQKAAAAPVPPPKYQRNRLDEAEARELVQKLEALMTHERPHANPALTLQTLADALGIPAHTASQLLNVHVGKSFFVFVNSHRVEALKVLLADPANAKRGVLELAFEVGFSSKSTVNDFFKKLTGLTPTAFRTRALAEKSPAKSMT